ncbi:gluconokinase [Nocardioides caldifontis]|uniref:gluconokinase n=1 Tax=Nocardioides caldifontis TaxID=2588938 RepID=UPI0011DF8575|nr:gluconokinase [Nocardioides caldifontis]
MASERAPVVVVMGVSGSGKTTVGSMLADRLGVGYGEADDFHPQANVDKMAAGQPLDDDDRRPWLAAIGAWLEERQEAGAVATCSALKHAYRDTLRSHAPSTVFLHLHGSRELLEERMGRRSGHFMPASLLESQLEILEPLDGEERGLTADVALTPEEIVDRFLVWWQEPAPG